LVVALVTALLWPNPIHQLASTCNAKHHENLSPGTCTR